MDGYRLIDAGDGARLERFGERVTDRPAPGALTARRSPGRWDEADLRFDRAEGWTAAPEVDARVPWTVEVDGLVLGLRATEAGQVGLFPEHLAMGAWLGRAVGRRLDRPEAPAVLHLFAYTGLGTLLLARAGAAVTHVDASRPAVAWARENAARNDLAERPIRWLVDDARDIVAREVRRGRRYDGLILDPPTYGHGGRAGRGVRPWRIGEDLESLLHASAALLADDGFALLTAHTDGLDGETLGDALAAAWRRAPGGSRRPETGGLTIRAEAGGELTLGAFARWDRAA